MPGDFHLTMDEGVIYWLNMFKRLKETKVMTVLAVGYFLCMMILGTSLFLVNATDVLATSGNETYNPPQGLNAFLWSSVAVLSFLFALCLAYFVIARIRKRKYSLDVEPK